MTGEFKWEWERLSPNSIVVRRGDGNHRFVYRSSEWEEIDRIKELLDFLDVEPSESELKRTGKK